MNHVSGLFILFFCIANIGCDIIGREALDDYADFPGVSGCSGGRLDEDAGLCWQISDRPGVLNWWDAMAYCDALDLAGKDWRVPLREDFIHMLGGCSDAALAGKPSFCSSCAESDKCSAIFGEDTNSYWTATSYGDTGKEVWTIEFNNGYTLINEKQYYNWTSCVRSIP
jgi:Protein of unknown function (DUF1566)